MLLLASVTHSVGVSVAGAFLFQSMLPAALYFAVKAAFAFVRHPPTIVLPALSVQTIVALSAIGLATVFVQIGLSGNVAARLGVASAVVHSNAVISVVLIVVFFPSLIVRPRVY